MGEAQPAVQHVLVDGHRLRLTNLDKAVYPATGTTKADVIGYWQTVAPVMIPHLLGRPATRKRWPEGVGTADDPTEGFFRKNLEESAPSWIPRQMLHHSDHTNTYPLVSSPAVLAWFGQVGALEVHVPQWTCDNRGVPQHPDRLVLDLDPGPGIGLAECAEVARWCRDILADMGMVAVPVTSGSAGLHLYADLDGRHTSDQVAQVARELARALEADHPGEVISRMQRSSRTGKVFIDWSQNNRNKTTIAPYSLRGAPRPRVAAPRTWSELDDPDLTQLDYQQVAERVSSGLDPLAALTPRGDVDLLQTYREMRDPAKTPEPVPAQAPSPVRADPSAAPIFVVHEHHARRLHFDTRLERDGVLVSWAVPKAPPLEQGVHRLAVRTENHPLEYAAFSGTIPRGEYGAGKVTIWDHGRIEIETWKPDKVVAVLHGAPDGGLGGIPRRYALIQTDGNQWLIRLTKTQPGPARSATPLAPVTVDRSVDPVADLPPPMLASAEPSRSQRHGHWQGWVFEGKWDGYRAIAGVTESGLLLHSRRGENLAATYPELAELIDLVPAGTVLDGEIVALGANHRPDFGRLQLRGRQKGAERAIAVHYFAFDILRTADHGDLTGLPYTERRELLRATMSGGQHVHVPDDLGTDITRATEISVELGIEGLVAKRANSSYQPGVRSPSWRKLVDRTHQEVVVIGWRTTSRSPTRAHAVSSLLVAVADADAESSTGLRYVGRVGSGFSERELDHLRSQLAPSTRDTSPARGVPEQDAVDATWVEPALVGEVRHHGWTAGGRLRQPVWRGTRPDKTPADVQGQVPD